MDIMLQEWSDTFQAEKLEYQRLIGSKCARSLCCRDNEKNSWVLVLRTKGSWPWAQPVACSLFLQQSGNIKCTVTRARCYFPNCHRWIRGVLYTVLFWQCKTSEDLQYKLSTIKNISNDGI